MVLLIVAQVSKKLMSARDRRFALTREAILNAKNVKASALEVRRRLFCREDKVPYNMLMIATNLIGIHVSKNRKSASKRICILENC